MTYWRGFAADCPAPFDTDQELTQKIWGFPAPLICIKNNIHPDA